MVLGTLKLNMDDVYVYEDGSLPKGPTWDKRWLKELVRTNVITWAAYNILPPSIREIASPRHFDPTLAIKISEIAECDILIVTRVATQGMPGKKFRFDNFVPITDAGQIELWRRI